MFELRKCSSYVRLVTGTSFGRTASHSPSACRAPLAVYQSQYGQSKQVFFFKRIFFFWLQHFFQIFLKSPKQPISSSPDSQHWPVKTARAVLTGPYRLRSEQASLGNVAMTESDVLRDLRKIWEKCGSQKKIGKNKETNRPFLRLFILALTDCEWRAAASGLKPLRLPRARSSGTGGGGDWWS